MANSCNNDNQNLSKTCVLLVFGIPATGKSSLVQQLVSRTDQSNNDMQCLHVCADDFYPADLRAAQVDENMSGQFNWKECRKLINSNIKRCLMINSSSDLDMSGFSDNEDWSSFIQKMCTRNNSTSSTKITKDGRFLSDNTVIIVDDNLPLRSMRHEYYQIAREFTSGFCEALITCDLATALLWNQQRSRSIPTNTIITMATTLEPPEPTKHHWEEMSTVMKSDNWWNDGDRWDEICGKVYQLCVLAMKEPVRPVIVEDITIKEESREITRESLIHQVDQKLRDCVSVVMQKYKEDCNKRTIADEAKHVNRIRKIILDEYRHSSKVSFQDGTDEILKTVPSRFNELYCSDHERELFQ